MLNYNIVDANQQREDDFTGAWNDLRECCLVFQGGGKGPKVTLAMPWEGEPWAGKS